MPFRPLIRPFGPPSPRWGEEGASSTPPALKGAALPINRSRFTSANRRPAPCPGPPTPPMRTTVAHRARRPRKRP
ncbi:hypothetical protein E0H67_02430 [Rhizobium leguminosarum bv. viciae]|nr:hypothetical protein E0H44_02895 [Rhizobium leguminosarum bv. viciae]TCA27158.1 hypothetical protein E0H67_02430 [Rhizobium leguminosarum bv. viciae]